MEVVHSDPELNQSNKRCLNTQSHHANASGNIKKRRRLESGPGCKNLHDSANYLAETYFNRIEKSLSCEGFKKFIMILVEYESQSLADRDEVALYRNVVEVFHSENKAELADGFISFIRPQTARKLGKLDESNFMTKAWSLFNSIDSNHFSKMLNVLESLSNLSSVKLTDIESALRPLFKGHQGNLVNSISQLFGSSKPPVKDLNEFEEVSDVSDNVEFEQVYIPRCDVSERSCPGDSSCSCVCHTVTPPKLCTACNIRYINGRIYVQMWKQMRSALVGFDYGVSRQEVQAKLYPQYSAQLASSHHITSHKGDKKERKNSLTESSKTDSKTDEQGASENSSSPPRNSSNSENPTIIIPFRSADKRLWGASEEQSHNVASVFFEENREGSLEFYKHESNDSYQPTCYKDDIEEQLDDHIDDNLDPEEPIDENLDDQIEEHFEELTEDQIDENFEELLDDQIEEHLPLLDDEESQEEEEEIMEDIEDITSDNEFDLQPSSSDELSSPTRYSPGKCVGSPQNFKNKLSKRNKK